MKYFSPLGNDESPSDHDVTSNCNVSLLPSLQASACFSLFVLGLRYFLGTSGTYQAHLIRLERSHSAIF